MELTDIKEMRRKQIGIINFLLIMLMALFFIIIHSFDIPFPVFYFIVGAFILLQAVFRFLKGASTKSVIPAFEKVANYERQKMGREWDKQRKMVAIWSLVLSGFMFWQSYITRGSADDVVKIDFIFMLIIALVTIGLINICLILRFRNIDRSISELDFSGYTWKSNLLGAFMGVVIAFIFFAITMVYILYTI
ncbi:hypothetical protein [Oceanobacillus massiliensis]|uniref:hypothetical protein n=1 Tax=Oceanobacillus massiliensis TaxID=1465765 RepID=UPI003017DEF3